jgi:hypothetical protein
MKPTEERALFRELTRVVNEFDLMGLQPGSADGAPADEYENEVRAIESFLVNTGRIEFADLSAIWLRWFGEDLRGHEAAFEPFLRELNRVMSDIVKTPPAAPGDPGTRRTVS